MYCSICFIDFNPRIEGDKIILPIPLAKDAEGYYEKAEDKLLSLGWPKSKKLGHKGVKEIAFESLVDLNYLINSLIIEHTNVHMLTGPRCILWNISEITGKLSCMEFNLTYKNFLLRYNSWQQGTLIQQAFPTLNCDQREFIKTGISKEEWDNMFPKELEEV